MAKTIETVVTYLKAFQQPPVIVTCPACGRLVAYRDERYEKHNVSESERSGRCVNSGRQVR